VLPFVRTRPLLGRTTAHAGAIFIVILVGVRIGVRGTTWTDPVLGFALDVLVGGCFANFLIAIRHDDHREALPGTAVYRWGADFSYSLYTIHTPIISVLGAIAVSELGMRWSVVPRGMTAWLAAFAYIAASLFTAYLFSLLTERNTTAARRWLVTLGVWLGSRRTRSS
jgi:peptidoglycan/LPS O-acetylase OafA/YrhL